ncbi:AAA family ATPase [uncultured Campylobacter sp.]|uniref:AAA family ATPase n=1 Tax=uncultured Campylobacter sp. TaxID=218934 RepID=UPI00260BE9EF|nr:AAA family ATPase [uncultured Campylobacter sp.]
MYKNKISNLITAISSGLFEREHIVANVLLAVIAGQSVFLYGVPGTAKSLIARRISLAFKDAKHFEYLMQRFSTPDEVFGPVDIKELKEGRYMRKIEGYLPSANFAFLDEIFKSSPAILNTLLTIINEKIFRNDGKDVKVPLHALIAASNETPAQGSGLEALYDRLNMRLLVEPLKEWDNFKNLIEGKFEEANVSDNEKITLDELNLIANGAKAVKFSPQSLEIIKEIRENIEKLNVKNDQDDSSDPYQQSRQETSDVQILQENQSQIYVSDRRWKNLAHILKTSAFLNDRSEVLPADVLLLANCLWSEKEQIEAIKNIVTQSAGKNLSSKLIIELEQRVARLADEYYQLCFLQDDEYKTKNFNGIPHYEFSIRLNKYTDPNDQIDILFYVPFSPFEGNPLNERGNYERRIYYTRDSAVNMGYYISVDKGALRGGWLSGSFFQQYVKGISSDPIMPIALRKKGDMIAIDAKLRDSNLNECEEILGELETIMNETKAKLGDDFSKSINIFLSGNQQNIVETALSNELKAQKRLKTKLNRLKKDISVHEIR